jgi:ABC-type Fe3+/spermidine/putrescine transport system ATPase subunit
MTNIKKLEIKNIKKSFENKLVLKDINFHVSAGEFLSILGPSGCGKTTLLRILIGLEKSDSGFILKDNEDISNLHPSKRGMGIVFQNYALFENMTVLQNVEYALIHNKDFKEKYSKQQIRQIVEKTINDVGLSEHINKRPTALSGGQQQRVAIARTLAMNPEIILFDEPMSALDVDTRLSLRAELKHIQKEYGSTMIYITHDQEEAFAMSEKIMIMNKGIIHQLDTPENIINNPADDFVNTFVINNLQIKMDSLIKYVKEK